VAAVSLNSNLAALRAKRALNASTAELSSNLERLSSGKRINHASDDAAGLAVASGLNTTTRVYTQAVRNVNDGISFLNVADGATSALKDILFRIRELSTQSSNGTFSNAQRQSIDKESQALQAEYGRILDTTSFNGIRVFGSGDVTVQAGVGTDAALLVNTSSAVSTNKGDGTFQARQAFSTGSPPLEVAVSDLNGDGKNDMVTADRTANAVSLFLGNGNGTFQVRQAFTTGTHPVSVAVADLNGDGKGDLVTGDFDGNTMSVLLGNGNGSFQAKQDFNAGTGPQEVAVADFNADGNNDLVTPDYGGGNTMSLLLGNGNGTFQAGQASSTGGGPWGVAAADLNGDGKSDVVVTDTAAAVFLGNGNGTFQARKGFGTGSSPCGVVVADLSGDGKSDLITADKDDGTTSVLLGNGDGTFQVRHAFQAGTGTKNLAVADLNGDGKIDLITANETEGTTSVLLGNGDGTFRAKQSFAVGPSPTDVAVADFNGDGRSDVVTADDAASVLLGNGTTVYGLQPILGVNLVTQEYALSSQAQIDSYLDSVNKVSGAIGTALSRFQIAAHVASSVADVSQAAEARITDADVAENSAGLVRNQIRQQAATAILAQANQQPALALTLLR
jgi:flagellin-like hook-associated protein FlgL